MHHTREDAEKVMMAAKGAGAPPVADGGVKDEEGRVKRRLETGETDYLLQNQKKQGL